MTAAAWLRWPWAGREELPPLGEPAEDVEAWVVELRPDVTEERAA